MLFFVAGPDYRPGNARGRVSGTNSQGHSVLERSPEGSPWPFRPNRCGSGLGQFLQWTGS